MRFRLGIGGPQQQQTVDSFGRGMQSLAMLPMLKAQAMEEYQNGEAQRALRESQQRQADAHTSLFQQQARQHQVETDALAGAPDVLDQVIASRAGTDVPTLRRWRQSVQSGVQPMTSATGDSDTDAAIGIPTQPSIEAALAQRIAQQFERLAPARINPKSFKVDDLAQAAGLYQKQDAVGAMVADPTQAARYGQAFASVEGKPLVQNIGNTGRGFNQFTGEGNTLAPGVAALYDREQLAEIGQKDASAGASRASAANSYASANQHRASTDKIRQEIDHGARTGALQVVTGPNGEVTVVDKINRTAQPVLGADGRPVVKGTAGGGGKPMTEGQSKANLFGGRMMESDKLLTEMEEAGVLRPGAIKGFAETTGRVLGLGTDSMGGTLADIAGAATNWTQNPKQQQVDQARRDFINAVLRRESGATIQPAEFANAEKQYFPQPGDSKAVIAQKRRNRQIATTLMLQEVPEAQRYKPGAVPPGGAPAAPAAPVAPEGSWGAPAAPGGWSIQRVN